MMSISITLYISNSSLPQIYSFESQVTKNPKCSVDLGDFPKHPATEESEAEWDELVWSQKTGIGVFF